MWRLYLVMGAMAIAIHIAKVAGTPLVDNPAPRINRLLPRMYPNQPSSRKSGGNDASSLYSSHGSGGQVGDTANTGSFGVSRLTQNVEDFPGYSQRPDLEYPTDPVTGESIVPLKGRKDRPLRRVKPVFRSLDLEEADVPGLEEDWLEREFDVVAGRYPPRDEKELPGQSPRELILRLGELLKQSGKTQSTHRQREAVFEIKKYYDHIRGVNNVNQLKFIRDDKKDETQIIRMAGNTLTQVEVSVEDLIPDKKDLGSKIRVWKTKANDLQYIPPSEQQKKKGSEQSNQGKAFRYGDASTDTQTAVISRRKRIKGIQPKPDQQSILRLDHTTSPQDDDSSYPLQPDTMRESPQALQQVTREASHGELTLVENPPPYGVHKDFYGQLGRQSYDQPQTHGEPPVLERIPIPPLPPPDQRNPHSESSRQPNLPPLIAPNRGNPYSRLSQSRPPNPKGPNPYNLPNPYPREGSHKQRRGLFSRGIIDKIINTPTPAAVGNPEAKFPIEDLEKYMTAWKVVKSNATAIIWPFLTEMLTGTNSTMMITAAWSIYTHLIPTQWIVAGPFFYGLTSLPRYDKNASNHTNSPGERFVNSILISHYMKTWNKSYNALNQSGYLEDLEAFNFAIGYYNKSLPYDPDEEDRIGRFFKSYYSPVPAEEWAKSNNTNSSTSPFEEFESLNGLLYEEFLTLNSNITLANKTTS